MKSASLKSLICLSLLVNACGKAPSASQLDDDSRPFLPPFMQNSDWRDFFTKDLPRNELKDPMLNIGADLIAWKIEALTAAIQANSADNPAAYQSTIAMLKGEDFDRTYVTACESRLALHRQAITSTFSNLVTRNREACQVNQSPVVDFEGFDSYAAAVKSYRLDVKFEFPGYATRVANTNHCVENLEVEFTAVFDDKPGVETIVKPMLSGLQADGSFAFSFPKAAGRFTAKVRHSYQTGDEIQIDEQNPGRFVLSDYSSPGIDPDLFQPAGEALPSGRPIPMPRIPRVPERPKNFSFCGWGYTKDLVVHAPAEVAPLWAERAQSRIETMKLAFESWMTVSEMTRYAKLDQYKLVTAQNERLKTLVKRIGSKLIDLENNGTTLDGSLSGLSEKELFDMVTEKQPIRVISEVDGSESFIDVFLFKKEMDRPAAFTDLMDSDAMLGFSDVLFADLRSYWTTTSIIIESSKAGNFDAAFATEVAKYSSGAQKAYSKLTDEIKRARIHASNGRRFQKAADAEFKVLIEAIKAIEISM